MGQVGVKVEGTYLRLKDSNAAVGVCNRATGKALEGADRQTDFPCIIVRFGELQYLLPVSREFFLSYVCILMIHRWTL